MVTDYCCGFCSREFRKDEAQPTCASCPLRGGCQLVRCPHCGYENPTMPEWIGRVRAWFGEPRRTTITVAARDEREVNVCR